MDSSFDNLKFKQLLICQIKNPPSRARGVQETIRTTLATVPERELRNFNCMSINQ